jgi:SAM-dependent methyltransferase
MGVSLLTMIKRQMHQRSFWNKASQNYDEYVTDKVTAYPEIRNYENFEESLTLAIVNYLATKGKDFAFIEAGSGTGRYMEILGYKVVRSIKNSQAGLFPYDDSLSKYLKVIVGIDFAKRMIVTAERRLRGIINEEGNSLYELLGDRLRFINRPIEDISEELILKGDEKGLTRFICCMFGTLGNIHREARKRAVRCMSRLVGDDGILLLSVFNRNKLKELGYYSYWAVQGLIGVPDINYEEGDVITKKGFLSHWYTIDGLSALAGEIDVKYKRLLVGERLGIQNEERKLDARRGLMLVASTGDTGWLYDVLREIKRDEVPKDSILKLERG